MLKSFDELIQVDVKPFCDLRDAKDEKGNVIKVPYLSWAKCAKLLHENGASSVWYAPRRCPETNTYLWPQAKITTSKGRITECWFVSVEIHIDDLEFSYDMPLLNGSLVVYEDIVAIVSVALLALGAIFVFGGVNVPLGLGLLVLGAVGLAATIAANWGVIKEALQGEVGQIVAVVSTALLALGVILLFTGAGIALGLGLILAGAAGLAAAIVPNWESIVEALQGPLGEVIGKISAALLVLGVVLLFTGAGVPLGLGLIAVGAVGLAAAIAPNWNFLLEKIKGVWEDIKAWFTLT